MGKWIIVLGCALVLLGAAIQFAPGLFSWFGKLPGDVRYEKGNFKLFFPLATMILISVVATVLIRLIGK